MSRLARDWGLTPVQTASGAPSWVRRALLGVTGALVLFGLLSVYSASSFQAQQAGMPDSYFFVNQLARAVFGAVVLFAATFIDYRVYRRLAWPFLGIVVLLLLIVLMPGTTGFAPVRNGARRWIMLGPVSLQPSELAKVAVVIWTATIAVRKQDCLRTFNKGVQPFLIVLGPVLLLILAEPHLSAALITSGIVAVVLFSAGARLRHFALLAGPVLPLLWIQVRANSYQLRRILAFINPDLDPDGVGYQLEQATIAIGSGRFFGVGFGESTQKLYYLPEPQNDFIFPIIAEEWGFIGALAVLTLFLIWTLMGLRIASSAPDLFGRLLAIGLTSIIAIGAFGHMGITMGMLPTTGVSLPFISAGGTGLVIAMGITGVLLNIASGRRC